MRKEPRCNCTMRHRDIASLPLGRACARGNEAQDKLREDGRLRLRRLMCVYLESHGSSGS
jgi:hypothetical protein